MCDKASGVIWVVATQAAKYLLVREPHLVFCLPENIEAVLNEISTKFRVFWNYPFASKENYQTKSCFQTQVYESFSAYKDKKL